MMQGTSVPVAIPSAVRRKMAQHGLQAGAEEGMRATTFVPPHQLMAQMLGHGDKFSLGISTMVCLPPPFLPSLSFVLQVDLG